MDCFVNGVPVDLIGIRERAEIVRASDKFLDGLLWSVLPSGSGGVEAHSPFGGQQRLLQRAAACSILPGRRTLCVAAA